jgi:alkanesulfonate monooxygenase SsuD/methylene tetrahydromethanopterin reductase-like flavin-dependent oxidoreductase (luciferase family)
VKPFRFWGAVIDVSDARALGERARTAEALGFDGLFVSDHLCDQLAPLPALAAIAAQTERLRMGTLVLNNDLRNPYVLAHELLTLDNRSKCS